MWCDFFFRFYDMGRTFPECSRWPSKVIDDQTLVADFSSVQAPTAAQWSKKKKEVGCEFQRQVNIVIKSPSESRMSGFILSMKLNVL